MSKQATGPAPAARTDAAVDTIPRALRRRAGSHPDVVALRTPGDAVSLTWAEVLTRSDALARGLRRLGVGRGDAVALMVANRPEFQLTDLAVLTLGGTPFSIYETLPAVQIEHLLGNSGARVVVVERQFLDRVLDATAAVPAVEHVVLLDGDDSGRTIAWADLLEPTGEDLTASAERVAADDIATLIYTSGTTGPPKGVELTHGNVTAGASALSAVLGLEPGSRVISWLPHAHIAERMSAYYLAVSQGLTVTCSADMSKLGAVLAEVHPDWFFAVPRVWEKLKASVLSAISAMPAERREAMEIAIADGLERIALVRAGKPVPAEVNRRAEAAIEMFAPMRAELGLDRARALHAGGAPSAHDVLEFFAALGAPVGELWGMSELSGTATMTEPGDPRIGTVGKPIDGVHVRTAADGELLVRGPIVMRGYRGEPQRTAETLGADGWLHTGDLATIDPDGSVRIVGRKKEIMINAAGKNMSAANIEAAVKSKTTLIAHVCAIGDRRPYVVALIVPDPERVAALSADAVHAEVAGAVAAANESLARVEQIKRFFVIHDDWDAGGDELTPTMKLKRHAIADRYAREIEALYSQHQGQVLP